MRIFIDESGAFQATPFKSTISLVGALIIPDGTYDRVLAKYARLRAHFPKRRMEVKGSMLDESQVAKILDILFKNGALFEAVAINLGEHTDTEIEYHRKLQMDKLTEGLTERHPLDLVRDLRARRAQLEQMSLPLYVQTVMIFELIYATLVQSTGYFSQRSPKELRHFHWCVDAKDSTITKSESWWRGLVVAALAEKSKKNPFPLIEGGDYTHFYRFDALPDAFQVEFLGADSSIATTDTKMVMNESFRFSADAEPGLELADIAVNATRRALVGNLQPNGWKQLARMMVDRPGYYIKFSTLYRPNPHSIRLPIPEALNAFRYVGRQLFVPRLR